MKQNSGMQNNPFLSSVQLSGGSITHAVGAQSAPAGTVMLGNYNNGSINRSLQLHPVTVVRSQSASAAVNTNQQQGQYIKHG